MKTINRIRSVFSRLLQKKQNKMGSSLALVVILGAVLVIWVLGIMPLMTGVSMNGNVMAATFDDYIASRSSIEFCKSELEKIVETNPPYTFCVVRNPSGTLSAIPKKLAAGSNPDYTELINAHLSDDAKDIPFESADNVVAICAVKKDSEESEYYIKVTTFNDGNAGMTYSTVYTVRGTLKINPESYLKSQALPLSDFVLVDGKLGGNTVWNSTIYNLTTDTNETDDISNLSAIKENLLPYLKGKLPGDGYADAGIFPAVFKTTVLPVGGGDTVVTPPAEPDYTDGEWIVPNAVDSSKSNKEAGDIYFKIVSMQYTYRQNGQNRTGYKNTIRIYLKSDSTDITSKCAIYLNGSAFTAYVDKSNHGSDIPTTGIYQVSIDFNGYNSVLPADGLILGEIGEVNNTTGGKRDKPTNLGVSVSGSTVTLAENSGAQYGYSTSDAPYNVTWSSSRTFTLQEGKTYFFFAYYPAATINGVYRTASDVAYMGYVSSLEFVNTLTRGEKYLILGKSNGTYYAMQQSSSSSTTLDSESVNVFFTGNAGVSNDLLWTVGINNGQYSFKNNLRYNNQSYGKYLNMTGSYRYSNWTINLNLSGSACYFSVNASTGAISKNFSSNNRNTTRYITYNNGFTQQSSNVSTSNRLYFAKVPTTPTAPDVSRISVPSSTVTLTANSIVYGDSLSGIVSGTYSKLFANGVEVTSTLNVGKYELTAQANNTTIPLGILNVTKKDYSNLSATPSVSVVTNTEKHEIIASANFHYNSGAHWIGYKVEGSSDAYKWFLVDDKNDYTFVLPYGNYQIIVRESGTITYNAAESRPITVELKAPEEEEETSTPSVMMGTSLYFMGRNGSIDTEGATIYLYSDLIVLRHDIIGDGSVIVYPYNTTDENTYNIEKYPDPDTLLFAVNDIKDAQGNVVFNALTFYRISSGTDLTDLTTCSNVTVTQNNDGSKVYTWKEGAKYNIDTDIETLKLFLRSGDHPEINMDIAYIDRENDADKSTDNQLAHIVSGETFGWTNNGKLVAGNDRNNSATTNNHEYVVCAFITEMTTDIVSRTANRIMIVAEETDASGNKSYTLNVPNSLTFTCRYFSIYAENIVQSTNNGSMTIEHLNRDQTLWDRIFDALDLTNYRSKSLQIDFEQQTTVYYNEKVNGTSTPNSYTNQGIFRIGETKNLFSAYTKEPLTVTYTNTEMYGFMQGSLSSLLNTSTRVVDRYVEIEKGSDASLSVYSLGNAKIEFYTNYIYFDEDVVSYNFTGLLGSADMIINSQERGYASEYLGFFTTNSVETYNGTIIYIAPDDPNQPLGKGNGGITVNGTLIHSGFYFIPARDNGTSIKELAKLPNDPTSDNYYAKPSNVNAQRINPEDLSKYSIYIKQDGTLSDAYVDIGLIGNDDLGESGFSGGNVG